MADVFLEYADTAAVNKYFSQKRLKKLARLKNPKAAALSAAAERALIRAVRAYFPNVPLPVEYDYTDSGKPYLIGNKAYISLSHSGDIAVCAISENEVGVDIQKISDYDKRLADRFFCREERDYINAADNEKYAFYEIWTRKEARVKLTGEGIGTDFAEINCLDESEYIYTVSSCENGKYVMCICEHR